MHSFEIQFINLIPVVILTAELIAVIVLLNLFLLLLRKKKQFTRQQQGIRLYNAAVGNGMGEAHILLNRTILEPVYVTENFEEITGLSRNRIEEDIEVLAEMMDAKSYKKFWNDYRNWNREENLTFDYPVKAIKNKWMRITVITCADMEEYDFLILQDISQEKQFVHNLQNQLERAEEESQSKTTFLSRMSHEIRTPINGIIGMLSLSRKQVAPNSIVNDYLEKAENLSQHLVALVNDILDMSRIEAGKIELENKTFDIRALADNLSGMFQENIEAKGVNFYVEFLDFENYYLVGDEFRLSQVIVNFLSNAMKFTSKGEIRVTFRQLLEENGIADILIRVHDTGIGMNPEFISRIFRPFEQENPEIAKNYGGTGLGMAISDQIVRLMGGEIVVESMPGSGSDFTVYLHLPVSGENQMEPKDTDNIPEYEDTYTFEGKRILMAEDNEINAEVAQEILSDAGATVEIAENGQIAVEKFANNEPGYYDFILMDIQMPVLNGREAARQIRQLPRKDAQEILIFALSADAFLEDERLSLEAQMDGHFAKPVDYEYVRKTIGQLVSRRQNR